ncbi:MAG: S-layer homology domain-containing protein [Candidatus Xenobia bacterium]
MRKQSWLASLTASAFALSLVVNSMPATSAPMFPDVPQEHWAKDAVAALAAKGLVEGYPDGTFKGDRAATRYEVAMIVARLLAKIEQEHATFATKADLEALRRLVNQLKDELDALGVRVQNLENNVGRLDKRVTELERIRFYGWNDSRFVSQGFLNNGLTVGSGGAVVTNNSLAIGTGGAAGLAPAALTVNTSAIGSNVTHLGGNFLTGLAAVPSAATGQAVIPSAAPGVVPVIDYVNGTPLTNGTGFSNVTTLGARIKVSDDIDAGAEFSAYVTAGDAVVDAFWGVTAPYLSNQFTANQGIPGGQGLDNTPFTRMNFDNFWMIHKPSGLRLQLGSFDGTNFDDVVYVGEYNPNPLGPRYLDNFGIDVRGRTHLLAPMTFEVMGTELADGNQAPATGLINGVTSTVGALGAGASFNGNLNGLATGLTGGYQPEAYGLNLDWDLYGNGDFKFNYMRAQDAQTGGSPLLTGQITGMNGVWLDWVNPNGFFATQPGVVAESSLAGAGTGNGNFGGVAGNFGTVGTGDNRPIFAPTDGTNGTFGPQSETMYGASVRYKFPSLYGIRFFAEYGNSRYKPNEQSNFVSNGNAFLAGLGGQIGAFDLSAEYVSTDPTYDPFILQYPQIDGVQNDYWRTQSFSYFPNAYPLHDTDAFPQNRSGYRVHLKFMAKDDRGEKHEIFHAWYYNLNQVQNSLPDQRFSTGALGGGIPNSTVYGFSPGWIDPVFGPESVFGMTGAGGNALSTANDNTRGNETEYGAHFRYRFGNTPWALGIGYQNLQFTRSTNFSSAAAGQGLGSAQGLASAFNASATANMDFVNLTSQGGVAQVNYTFSDRFVLKFGIATTQISGHLDPTGIYNNFAFDSGNNTFNNFNSTENYPFIGFDYDISKNTRWGFNVKFFNTTDNLNQTSFLSSGPLVSNIERDPFNWNGVQVTSQVKVSF